jgi:hypothetical protein
MSVIDGTAGVLAAVDRAPEAVERVREMGIFSAEGCYSAAYLAWRLGLIDERPAASGFAVGVDHAAVLRQEIDAALPSDVPVRP